MIEFPLKDVLEREPVMSRKVAGNGQNAEENTADL